MGSDSLENLIARLMTVGVVIVSEAIHVEQSYAATESVAGRSRA